MALGRLRVTWRTLKAIRQALVTDADVYKHDIVSCKMPGEGADVMVPSQALAFGVRYSISLNTDLLEGGKSENRQYSGDFCLSTQPGGGVRVHDLWLGDRAALSEQDACFGLYRNAKTWKQASAVIGILSRMP